MGNLYIGSPFKKNVHAVGGIYLPYPSNPEIVRSLRRSRLRRDVLAYLKEIYPASSYPAEIARGIGSDASDVIGVLVGRGRYSRMLSLLSLGLVEIEYRSEEKYYRLTKQGLEAIEKFGKVNRSSGMKFVIPLLFGLIAAISPHSFASTEEAVSIKAIGWNGDYWLIGGEYYNISGEHRTSSRHLLARYDGKIFTDIAYAAGLKDGLFTAVTAFDWNGEYWLIGTSGGIVKKYDGNVWEDLTASASFGEATINSITWNGKYWLVGGGYGKLKKYDGNQFTDLTAFANLSWINTIAWNGDYFLIGGGFGKVAKGERVLVRFDREKFIDLTSVAGLENTPVWSIGWNGSYWLIGSNKLLKYDGAKFEDLSPNFFGNRFSAIAWNGEYWLINTYYGEAARYSGTHVENLTYAPAGYLKAAQWNGDYWLLGGVPELSFFPGYLKKFNGLEIKDLTYELMASLQPVQEVELGQYNAPYKIDTVKVGYFIIAALLFFTFLLIALKVYSKQEFKK